MKPALVLLSLTAAALACSCYRHSPESRPVEPRSEIDTVYQDSCNLYWGIACAKGTPLDKGHFFVNYNCAWRIPYWVGYRLSDSNFIGNADRKKCDWKPDTQLSNECRALKSDYKKSNYDRGHMAPAACFKCRQSAMCSTFVLSNAAPQTPSLNSYKWKDLEQLVRDIIKSDSISDGWVFTGNAFMDADSHWIEADSFLDKGRVAVPTHCFKAVLFMRDDSSHIQTAFLMPNRTDSVPGRVDDYRIDIEKLEEITGWDFFVRDTGMPSLSAPRR